MDSKSDKVSPTPQPPPKPTTTPPIPPKLPDKIPPAPKLPTKSLDTPKCPEKIQQSPKPPPKPIEIPKRPEIPPFPPLLPNKTPDILEQPKEEIPNMISNDLKTPEIRRPQEKIASVSDNPNQNQEPPQLSNVERIKADLMLKFSNPVFPKAYQKDTNTNQASEVSKTPQPQYQSQNESSVKPIPPPKLSRSTQKPDFGYQREQDMPSFRNSEGYCSSRDNKHEGTSAKSVDRESSMEPTKVSTEPSSSPKVLDSKHDSGAYDRNQIEYRASNVMKKYSIDQRVGSRGSRRSIENEWCQNRAENTEGKTINNYRGSTTHFNQSSKYSDPESKSFEEKRIGIQKILQGLGASRKSLKREEIDPDAPLTVIQEFVALYDFKAEKEEDLSFRKGEKIYMLKDVDDNWGFGFTYDESLGIFPKCFVRALDTKPTNDIHFEIR